MSSSASVLPYAAPALPRPGARPRLHFGDPIRLIGTIAVIVGHVCDMGLYTWGSYGKSISPLDWWACNVLDVASRWAVPVFLMLSGALLLDPTRQETPLQFYKRRFSRVGVPTLFWSPVFMLFAVEYLQWVPSWRHAWTNFALGAPYAHMHFLFRIVGLYLFTPMLRVFVRHADRRLLVLSVILAFALAGGHSIVGVLTGGQPNAFSRFVPFIGYYLCGYLMRDVKVTRKGYVLAWLGFLTTVAIVALTTGLLLQHLGQKAPVTTGAGLMIGELSAPYPVAHIGLEFLNPVRIVMGLCVWIIFTHTFTSAPPNKPFFNWLSKSAAPATLGVYLVHPLFRDVIYKFDPLAKAVAGVPVLGWLFAKLQTLVSPLFCFTHSWYPGCGHSAFWHSAFVGVPAVTIIVLVFSFALTLLLAKLPVGRWIIGSLDSAPRKSPAPLNEREARKLDRTRPMKQLRGILILIGLALLLGVAVFLILRMRHGKQKTIPAPAPTPAAVVPAAGIDGPPSPTSRPGPPPAGYIPTPTSRPVNAPGHYRLLFRKDYNGQQLVRPYMLYLPEGYDPSSTKKWPLIMFLHGGWESGSDFDLLVIHGPAKEVEWHPAFRKNFPFIVLTPQSLYEKTFVDADMGQFAMDLLDDVCGKFPVDPNRVYATGLSWGGAGVWNLASEHPDRFAAIAPLCTKEVDAPKMAARLKNVPVFMSVGANDDEVYLKAARELDDAFRKAGGNARLTIVPDRPHDIWSELYAGRELYDWFLSHPRK